MAFVWEQRKLGEVADIIGGGTPSTSYSDYWDGDIDWYAPAEISDQIFVDSSERKITKKGYENSSAKMLPVGAVLFTSRAGIGKTAILSRKGCTNQGFQSIVPHKDKLDSYFIFSRSEELKRYGETVGAGSTFVEVSGKQMANMELMLPENIEEQQVIGEYFKNLDHLITLHQCKFHFCKKNEVNAWEQRKLGDICTEMLAGGDVDKTKLSDDGNYPVLANALTNDGIVGYYEKDYRVKAPAITITGRGDVGHAKARKQDFTPVVRLLAIRSNHDADFLENAINTLKIVVESTGVPQLTVPQLEKYEVFIPPTIEEEKVMGSYFVYLDNLITLHQRKRVLRKCFFSIAWEQRKLGEFVDKAVDNRGKTPPLDANGNHPLIEVAALGGVHPDYSKVEKYLSEDSFGNNLRAYIKKGDILFTTVGSIGLVSLMDSREEAAIAQNIVAFRAKENFVPEYLYALFSNEGNQYKAQRIVMGAVQPSIKVSQLVDVEYILANNVEEQRLIGEYFSYLDHLITLHQWECNINENTEGNDEKQRKPIKKLIISEGDLSLVDDMFLLHRMTFFVCYKYILLRLNVVKYKITIIIINNILYSIVSLLIIACYLIVINKQLIILIYVEISVVIIKGDDDYARIRS